MNCSPQNVLWGNATRLFTMVSTWALGLTVFGWTSLWASGLGLIHFVPQMVSVGSFAFGLTLIPIGAAWHLRLHRRRTFSVPPPAHRSLVRRLRHG